METGENAKLSDTASNTSLLFNEVELMETPTIPGEEVSKSRIIVDWVGFRSSTQPTQNHVFSFK
jgi:hypothetical protein